LALLLTPVAYDREPPVAKTSPEDRIWGGGEGEKLKGTIKGKKSYNCVPLKGREAWGGFWRLIKPAVMTHSASKRNGYVKKRKTFTKTFGKGRHKT